MSLRPLTIPKYNNVISSLDGHGLSSSQADIASRSDVRAKFRTLVDAVIADDPSAAKTAHEYLTSKLTEASVNKILEEIHPGLSDSVAEILGRSLERIGSSGSSARDLQTAFDNVRSLLEYGEPARLAREKLAAKKLTLESVAYADGHRTFGVMGDYIADVKFEAFEPNSATRRIGSPRSTMTCPIVKDSNWTGPFGVIDLASFTVSNKDGRIVSLEEVIEDPAKHVNGWNGPDKSFFNDELDVASRSRGRVRGPKAAVMDALVPATDGHTDTVPTIQTYGKPMLVLVAVPGEGISAHYTDGSSAIRLPIHQDGREKALRITRQQFSDRDGPTSFDRGASAVDDMLINSALIIQIPVHDPDRPRIRGGFLGGYGLESLGGATSLGLTTRGLTRSARSLDSGNFGTEAGVVSAGGDLGRQKDIPNRISRTDEPIRADFVLYAATDSNVISDALASRMRNDMDSIIKHPSCIKAGREN